MTNEYLIKLLNDIKEQNDNAIQAELDIYSFIQKQKKEIEKYQTTLDEVYRLVSPCKIKKIK